MRELNLMCAQVPLSRVPVVRATAPIQDAEALLRGLGDELLATGGFPVVDPATMAVMGFIDRTDLLRQRAYYTSLSPVASDSDNLDQDRTFPRGHRMNSTVVPGTEMM